jgi:hypothetical protein
VLMRQPSSARPPIVISVMAQIRYEIRMINCATGIFFCSSPQVPGLRLPGTALARVLGTRCGCCPPGHVWTRCHDDQQAFTAPDESNQ